MRAKFAGLFFLLIFTTSCSGFMKSLTVSTMIPTLHDMMEAANKQTDPQLIKDSLPSSLVMIDGLAQAAPDNKEILMLAGQAYCGYALAFIQDEDRGRASKLYEHGKVYSMKVLLMNDATKDALYKDGKETVDLDAFTKSLEDFDEDDVPYLFWAGNCWAGWISMSGGSPRAVAGLPLVVKIMERVRTLDEGYYYAGAHLFFGAYNAGRPKLLGGDPVQAKKDFDRAIELTQGKFLLHKVFYAQYYARAVQDVDAEAARALYEKLLKEVIDAPDDILPEQNLVNAISKKKAKKLLEDADSYF